mgnify:CR=1 FL=1|tara:strand:- start:293 stop:667 length:375 start_codon:yes stop_codon:yes gene_type:complete
MKLTFKGVAQVPVYWDDNVDSFCRWVFVEGGVSSKWMSFPNKITRDGTKISYIDIGLYEHLRAARQEMMRAEDRIRMQITARTEEQEEKATSRKEDLYGKKKTKRKTTKKDKKDKKEESVPANG